ncbi:MAG: sortase [Actinomycetota bacterium]|nr:sortase [Actinomycetota bacterium]
MQRFQTRRRAFSRVVLLAVGVLVFAVGIGLLLSALLEGRSSALAPESKALRLTVPVMRRAKNLPVYDAAPSGYESALRRSSVHVRGTGWPWQEGANVYIAGHRLGYPGTRSWLVFRDLDKLQNGDEVILTDANGTRYTYEVFKEFTFGPNEERVLEPVASRSVVTLQSCTLPNYARRIAVQAELVDVIERAG